MVRAFLAKFSPKSERRLLALCLNNPYNDQDLNEWNRNAVRYLVKELRKDLRLIDELERAITQKNAKSKCVTLPKTPDRRLLVSHRRGLPQVIYGRLWRWPDLQSHHQIRAIHTCESSTEYSSGVEQPGDSQRVCINPYHYERYNPKPIEPVLVPCSRIPPDLSTSFEDSDTTGETKGRPSNLSFLQHLAPYFQQQQGAASLRQAPHASTSSTFNDPNQTIVVTTSGTTVKRSGGTQSKTVASSESLQTASSIIASSSNAESTLPVEENRSEVNLRETGTPPDLSQDPPSCPPRDTMSDEKRLRKDDSDKEPVKPSGDLEENNSEHDRYYSIDEEMACLTRQQSPGEHSWDAPRPVDFDQETYDFLEKMLPEVKTPPKDEMMEDQISMDTQERQFASGSVYNPSAIESTSGAGPSAISQQSPQAFQASAIKGETHEALYSSSTSYQNVANINFTPQEPSTQYQLSPHRSQSQQVRDSPHYEQFTQYPPDQQAQQDQPMVQDSQSSSQPQFYHQQQQTQTQYQIPRPKVEQQQQHSPQYAVTTANQQHQFLHSQSQPQYQMSPQHGDYLRSQELYSQSTDQRHYQQSQQPAQGQFSPQSHPGSQYQHQYRSNLSQQSPTGPVSGLQQRQQQQRQQVPLVGSCTEIARPFRFKQNRFAHMARARHEHSIVSRYPMHDPHGYISSPYRYSSQPSTQIQVTYQQPFRPQGGQQSAVSPTQDQQAYPSPYSASSATGSNQPQSGQYPQGTGNYPAVYSSQQPAQYSRQGQPIQIGGYPTDSSMSVASQGSRTYYPTTGPGSGPTPSQNLISSDQAMDQATPIDIQEVPYTEGTYWCSISYHEYDQRIGEKYHSNCRVVAVDGYTQPMCNDRFCIGGISNVNRHQFTEWVRRRIGRGVKVTYVDGEVYVEGLSEASVFVSNPLLVEEDGDQYIEHVSKLTLGCSAKVFSTQQFSKLLADAVAKGFEAVYKLTNCCVIRVSFVKGWGRNYKRQSIFNTPCWVEVQLNGPLQWIDKVLRQMRPPTGCGSTS